VRDKEIPPVVFDETRPSALFARAEPFYGLMNGKIDGKVLQDLTAAIERHFREISPRLDFRQWISWWLLNFVRGQSPMVRSISWENFDRLRKILAPLAAEEAFVINDPGSWDDLVHTYAGRALKSLDNFIERYLSWTDACERELVKDERMEAATEARFALIGLNDVLRTILEFLADEPLPRIDF
jgi:hypothetical protein